MLFVSSTRYHFHITHCVGVQGPNARPDKSVEVGACVTSIAWHPHKPATLALGTYTGEVHVHDLNRGIGDTLVAVSRRKHYQKHALLLP